MSNAPNAEHLKAYVERIERLEEEKRAIGEDIKEVYTEAKSTGYDPKVMKKIISTRRKKAEAAREEAELFALYADALGMQLRLAI